MFISSLSSSLWSTCVQAPSIIKPYRFLIGATLAAGAGLGLSARNLVLLKQTRAQEAMTLEQLSCFRRFLQTLTEPQADDQALCALTASGQWQVPPLSFASLKTYREDHLAPLSRTLAIPEQFAGKQELDAAVTHLTTWIADKETSQAQALRHAHTDARRVLQPVADKLPQQPANERVRAYQETITSTLATIDTSTAEQLKGQLQTILETSKKLKPPKASQTFSNLPEKLAFSKRVKPVFDGSDGKSLEDHRLEWTKHYNQALQAHNAIVNYLNTLQERIGSAEQNPWRLQLERYTGKLKEACKQRKLFNPTLIIVETIQSQLRQCENYVQNTLKPGFAFADDTVPLPSTDEAQKAVGQIQIDKRDVAKRIFEEHLSKVENAIHALGDGWYNGPELKLYSQKRYHKIKAREAFRVAARPLVAVWEANKAALQEQDLESAAILAMGSQATFCAQLNGCLRALQNVEEGENLNRTVKIGSDGVLVAEATQGPNTHIEQVTIACTAVVEQLQTNQVTEQKTIKRLSCGQNLSIWAPVTLAALAAITGIVFHRRSLKPLLYS